MGRVSKLLICLLMVVVCAALAPDRAVAVECTYGGAGANPAGDDNGVATNTTCGQNATAKRAAGRRYGRGGLTPLACAQRGS